MNSVRAMDVTSENFAKFGSVVGAPTVAPTSQAPSYKFWSDLANYHIEGETEIGLCTVYRQPRMEITGVERHLKSPEILIPIDAPFILPLLPDGKPESELEAFRVDIGQAVIVGSGVWHGACLPVGKPESSYFVIFRRRTPYEDVEKKLLPPVLIEGNDQ